MKTLLAAIVGLALAGVTTPAMAYVVGITTSIPVESAADDEQLTNAIRAALDDVLGRAIAFVPTVISVQDARVVGDRIYILLLVADRDGEETMRKFSDEAPAAADSPRETTAL